MKYKKIFILVLLIFTTFQMFATEKHTEIFLYNYFGNLDYEVVEYPNKNDLLYFAFYSKDNNNIFQRAIIFKSKGNAIFPLLYFNRNEIYNLDKKLVAPEIQTQVFYGWKASMGWKNDSFSVRTAFYTDDGLHVTDGINLILKNDTFENVVHNTSEL